MGKERCLYFDCQNLTIGYLAQYHTYHTQRLFGMYNCYAFALCLILTGFVMMVYRAKCLNPTCTFLCAVHSSPHFQSSVQTGDTGVTFCYPFPWVSLLQQTGTQTFIALCVSARQNLGMERMKWYLSGVESETIKYTW